MSPFDIAPCLYKSNNGEIWAGIRSIYRFEDSIWKRWLKRDGIKDYSINFIHQAENGDIWLATRVGVARFDGMTSTSWSTADGLPGITCTKVISDRKGYIWVATNGGLGVFDGHSWESFDEPGTEIKDIIEDHTGNIWVIGSAGLCRFSPNKIDAVNELSSSYMADIYINVIPNPFNSSTTISYTLPFDAKVAISVYDITGRKVRTLVSGSMDAGAHSVLWNGRDDSGRRVSSGLYLARVEAGGRAAVGKMLLMK